ncbi:MAG TPA: universal stress protein [Acidothermaceae bacterium]|nr:universal stress protein [Acidothermaceae bacterium]
MVGVDGSPSSWDALCWAAGEATRSNGRVVAVYVTPYTEVVAAFAVPYDYAGVEQARQEVAAELKLEATTRAKELGVELDFLAEHGDVTHVLTDVARATHANLIVVGRSAKVLHHLGSSLSNRLTSRNNAPVVVVVP